MNFFDFSPETTQQLIIGWTPGVLSLMGKLLYAVAILFVGQWLAGRCDALAVRLLQNAKVDESLSIFLGALVRYAVLAATVIAALEKLDIRTASLLAVFASAGLAVGLALQGSLANFAAGTMILFFRPFTKGDFVEAGGKTGSVEEIGLFTTTLLTPNNEVVIVPNSSVTGNNITNYTAKEVRRGEVGIGVAYGENAKQVVDILQQAAEKNSLSVEDPAPGVYFDAFGASSLNFKVRAFAKQADYWNMLHELRIQIHEDLNEAGVEIPFDQIVVHQAPTD